MANVSGQVKEAIQNRDDSKLRSLLGDVDPETKKFREAHKKAGFPVVFSQGMTREQVIAVLNSPETKRIVGDYTGYVHSKYNSKN